MDLGAGLFFGAAKPKYVDDGLQVGPPVPRFTPELYRIGRKSGHLQIGILLAASGLHLADLQSGDSSADFLYLRRRSSKPHSMEFGRITSIFLAKRLYTSSWYTLDHTHIDR